MNHDKDLNIDFDPEKQEPLDDNDPSQRDKDGWIDGYDQLGFMKQYEQLEDFKLSGDFKDDAIKICLISGTPFFNNAYKFSNEDLLRALWAFKKDSQEMNAAVEKITGEKNDTEFKEIALLRIPKLKKEIIEKVIDEYYTTNIDVQRPEKNESEDFIEAIAQIRSEVSDFLNTKVDKISQIIKGFERCEDLLVQKRPDLYKIAEEDERISNLVDIESLEMNEKLLKDLDDLEDGVRMQFAIARHQIDSYENIVEELSDKAKGEALEILKGSLNQLRRQLELWQNSEKFLDNQKTVVNNTLVFLETLPTYEFYKQNPELALRLIVEALGDRD